MTNVFSFPQWMERVASKVAEVKHGSCSLSLIPSRNMTMSSCALLILIKATAR